MGAINGKLPDVVNAILTGAEKSVTIAFSLIGIMAFWLGIMKIAEKSGLVELFAKLIKIFEQMTSKAGFVVEKSAIEKLKTIIYEYKDTKNFGNARFVRNVYEKTII